MKRAQVDWWHTLRWLGIYLIALWCWLALDLPLGPTPDQAQRPERPVEAPELVTRPTGYTGPASCLVWGVGQPESCRGELPECLEEDGSGPGITCWFTDPDHGKLWLQTGDD